MFLVKENGPGDSPGQGIHVKETLGLFSINHGRLGFFGTITTPKSVAKSSTSCQTCAAERLGKPEHTDKGKRIIPLICSSKHLEQRTPLTASMSSTYLVIAKQEVKEYPLICRGVD
eukprot:8536095-Karenia_brevis.AAC.1